MARRKVVQYFDDLDGSPLAPEDVNQVRFSLNGNDYLLELSAENHARFIADIQPYVAKANRDVRPRRGRGSTPGMTNGIPTKDIREWATRNGETVSSRGRLPQELVNRYMEAKGMIK